MKAMPLSKLFRIYRGWYGVTLAAIAAAMFAAPAVSSADSTSASAAYVRRGLVAQYDGIDNAGTGTHDASATTWKNLAGDTSLDATIGASTAWNGKNGWTTSGNTKPFTVASPGLAPTFATTNFTVQFACVPAVANKRMSYFGQYATAAGINIEQSVDGKLRFYRAVGLGQSPAYDKTASTATVVADTYLSAAVCVSKSGLTLYNGGALQQTISGTPGAIESASASVIGGEVQDGSKRTGGNFTSGYGITFQGTYYAFRVYNVALTAVEVAWNAGLDAVRFNGADAATVLGPEYSYDAATDTLTTDATYYAPKPGTDAADGLKFDISFTGDATADGLTFSTSNADEKQGYATADVTLPVYPIATNANTTCLYFPTPSDTTALTTYRQDARKANAAVTGRVATVYCRFRWDGAVQPSKVNYPTLIANAYTSWSVYPNEGFMLRLRSDANSSQAQFSLVVPNLAVPYNGSAITKTGTATIDAGRWVDVFASVYPSPTNPELSNADIWFCQVPSWNTNGYFNTSEICHYHFADGCAIPRMVTTTQKTVIFGSEPNAVAEPRTWSANGDNIGKCFRGAIAAAKGWDRLLSEDEMWTVMAGLDGVQSFTDLETPAARTYTTEYLDTDAHREGRNGTQISFLGGDPAAHRWRSLTQTYRTNTLIYDAPKDADPMPVVYSTKIRNASSGKAQPIHLEANGTKVWPGDAASKEVAIGEEIRVEIGAEHTYPGLNELKWVYDTSESSNWLIFDHHALKLVTPPNPFVMVVR